MAEKLADSLTINEINKVIDDHTSSYENREKILIIKQEEPIKSIQELIEEAKTFNTELYKCLNCTYKDSDKSDFIYFNPMTDKEKIEEQEKALAELKNAYLEKDNLNEFTDLLYEYVLKYVYSKRNYEGFLESEIRHSIDHNLRVAYFVKNVLEKIEDKSISEEFKKDAIINAVLHDVTHRGSPDFTDHESVVQFNLFIKTLSGIDSKYDQNILTNKDKLDINKLEKEGDKIEKNKSSYILASLVGLGDCVDIIRCEKIDKNIFNSRINNVYKLTGINQDVLNKAIQQSTTLCQSIDGRSHLYNK